MLVVSMCTRQHQEPPLNPMAPDRQPLQPRPREIDSPGLSRLALKSLPPSNPDGPISVAVLATTSTWQVCNFVHGTVNPRHPCPQPKNFPFPSCHNPIRTPPTNHLALLELKQAGLQHRT